MSIQRIAAILVATTLGLTACVALDVDKSENAAKAKKLQTLWPPPPNQPRFEYETSLRSAADVVREDEDMRWERMLTGKGVSTAPVIDKPLGIVSRGGLVYVVEPVVKAITVFDAGRGKIFRFGQREPNVLDKPVAIAIDANKQVYVLDRGLGEVLRFDQLGLFDARFPLKGFTYPIGLAVSPDGETIYVVDRGDIGNVEHKVVAFGRDGTERFRIGPRGGEQGKFNIPLAAATGADGSLYVVDSGNFRVQKFDPNGKFVFSFGGLGAEPGRFSRPRSIALDGDGNIYVSDGGFGNVQIFDPQGQLLMAIGSLLRKPEPGYFPLIAGITVDETNRLYVIDHYYRKIDVFKRLTEEEGQRRMASKQ